jgi:drug/metabolite transporter (DMT)-like permease
VAVLGLAMFGDFPDGWTLLGAAIIVASGLYTWHRDHKAAAAAATPS